MILHHFRSALRQIMSRPSFAMPLVASMTLAIGAGTGLFSLADGLILRSLPVKDPDRLFFLSVKTQRGANSVHSLPFFLDIARLNTSLAGVAARSFIPVAYNAADRGERLVGEAVSGNYFAVLGVRMALGRPLHGEDDIVGKPAYVCVVSYDFWRTRLAADPRAIGRDLILNGRTFRIAGVSQVGYHGTVQGVSVDIRIPLAAMAHSGGLRRWDSPGARWLDLIARLRPELTHAQAQQELTALASRVLEPKTGSAAFSRVELTPATQGRTALREVYERPLLVVCLGVGIMFLLSCVSAANMQLARLLERRQELAVRSALGACRATLALQLTIESIVLAAVGGVLGLAVGWYYAPALLGFLPGPFGHAVIDIPLDGRTLAFCVAASTLAAVLLSLPALFMLTRHAGHGLSSSRLGSVERGTVRKVLIAGQVALALVLLFHAGLFYLSLTRLRSISPGFNPEKLVLLTGNPALNGHDAVKAREFFERLLENLRALPNVRGVGLATVSLLSGQMMARDFVVPGYTGGTEEVNHYWNRAGLGYFQAMGIPVLLGRDFDERDTPTSARVAIVNRRIAERYWPGQNPVGKHVLMGKDTEIVGVVGDTKYSSPKEDDPLIVYSPISQGALNSEATIHIRAEGDLDRVAADAIARARSIDNRVTLYGITTMSEQLDRTLATERLLAGIAGFFGVSGLIIAIVGLWGLVNFVTEQRTAEIAVRLAIGATPSGVTDWIVWDSCKPLLLGTAAGLIISHAALRTLQAYIASITVEEAWISVPAALVLCVFCIVPVWIRARRAAFIQPASALATK